EDQRKKLKIPALIAAIGPLSVIIGGLTTTGGGGLKGFGKVSTTLGRVVGAGMLGRLGMLCYGGIVGLAIASVSGVGYRIYKLIGHMKESNEVNLDLAQSFADQATELDKNVQLFNDLSDKSKLSNDELARMNSLNQQIKETTNPDKIDELSKEYQTIAEKSELSNDEIERLFSANNNIIEQSQDVETSISNQGDEFVKSTKKAEEYAQTLRNMSETELKGQRLELLNQVEQ